MAVQYFYNLSDIGTPDSCKPTLPWQVKAEMSDEV